MLRRTIIFLHTRGLNQIQFMYSAKLSNIKPHVNQTIQENSSSASWVKKADNEETKEYFLKDDPDTFGTLSTGAKQLTNDTAIDEGDLKEEAFLENPPAKSKKLSTKKYADIIKAYIRKRQIKEAIDVLEMRMIKDDKVKPENYIYNLILGACGRVGYTKKAFKLFNDMKKRDLKPTGGTYTALFNACSNSPWTKDGLSRAKHLRELMIEKGVIPNDTNYNAMIKAFGRCGDIHTSFSLVDEMVENNIPIKEDTINFLLQSCISSKDVGFRHALLVWRKFHQRNIKPNIYSFNLMLRCIRDCGIGDVETINKLLSSPEFKSLNSPKELKISNKDVNSTPQSLLESNNKNLVFLSNESLQQNTSKTEDNIERYNWPNLMASVPYLGNIIELKEITKPEDRLILVGGCSGFLQNMKDFEIKPDIKTFTQLLDCIPSTLAAEKVLLSAMKKEKIRTDVNFLNMLIKKRSMRFDYESAKDVLTMFKPPTFRPDIITYGVLALGCQTKEEAQSLLEEMEAEGYRINIEILGAMLKQGCIKLNCTYVLEIMEIVMKEHIKPNKIFIDHLQEFNKRCKQISKEKNDKSFTNAYRTYRAKYKTWIEKTEIDNTDEIHPWEQFRKPTETNVKNYKDKETHFKPRIMSRYRQKSGILNK